jgi:hypothetical protein
VNRARHVLAAIAYVVVALWGMRAVLPAPSVVLPYPADHEATPNFKLLSQADQIKEAAGTIRALSLLLDPGRLLDADCHPLPKSIAFGEHMYGEALLAAVPYALTGDPILTFNVVLLLGLVLSGLSMYALAFYWTRDAGAAFLAGLLFLILPARLGDPQHPFCHGDYWIPLFLLFLHRVVTQGRWRDTAALAVVGSLQCLESAYTLVEFGLVGGVYAMWVAVQHWRRLPAVLPQLVIAAATIVVVALTVLAPFFDIRDVWPPSGRFSMPWPSEILGFGGAMYAGTVAFVLAIVGLVDRLLRRGLRGDPRIAMFAAGLLCAWLGTAGLVVVLGEPSWIAFRWLWSQIGHNFAGVRVLPLLMHGVPLAVTFLAAWGAAALARMLPPGGRPVLIGALAAVALVEVFQPDVARVSFGRTVEMNVQAWRPTDAALALYDRMDGDGPVLDLPFTPGLGGGLLQTPHYAVARMYHGHRTATCTTSIEGPLEPDVAALGARLPDAAAVDALYALGFRYVVVHDHLLGPRDLGRWNAQRATSPRSPSFVSLGRVVGHELFELRSASPVVASLDALRSSATAAAVRVQAPIATIPFTFRNTSAETYRHPDPIQPTPIRMVWQGRNGERERVYERRLLFPIALGPGEELARSIPIETPEPGSYEVTIAAAADPGRVLARTTVDVEPSEPPADAPRS